MPIYVDVWINDRGINTYAIGRIEGGTDPDDVNVYAVMELPGVDRPLGWDMSIKFEHRYGDGANVCVRKALAALAAHKRQLTQQAICNHTDSEGNKYTEPIFEKYGYRFCPKCGKTL